MCASVLEELHVFKAVAHKIRSTLVSGREEMVSPTVVSRSFLDSFEKMVPATSQDSGISSGEREGSPGGHRQCECPFIEPAEGWSVEYSHKNCEQCSSDVCMCPQIFPSLELRPLVEAEYRRHFYQKEHWTYYTEEPDLGPCVLSLKSEADGTVYRLLVRSSDHYVHGVVGVGELVGGELGRVDREEVVAVLAREMALQTTFKPALFPDIQADLLKIDETFLKSHHKVGVLRIKRGQSTEEEIFANGHEPGAFDDFLSVLGKRVRTKGFQGFLGGLDNERDMTGQFSVSTEFADLEVMFHVSTLMPYDPNDPQQVNKKRHIGNDMVCVVFLDEPGTVFNPAWVRSHFIHCYIVVQHTTDAHGQPLYRMGVATRSTVPSFSPELRSSGLFSHSRSLQQLVLTKVINAERASYHAPKFLRLTNRSRAQLLLELTESLTEYTMASKQGRATRKINRRANWLPVGATRPPSPMMDSVHQKHSNGDQLAEDFQVAFRGCELADVVFIVGEDHMPLYAVKAILACRSRVFRTMFQEGQAPSPARRFTSPMVRRRLPTASNAVSPQGNRKLSHSGSKPKLGGLARRKKSAQELSRSASPDPPAFFFCDDPRSMQIKEQYVVEEFDEIVFSELLSYLTTGQCSIKPETVVGIACVAEKFEVEELKQACLDNLPNCFSVASICTILTQLEQYLSYAAAKTIVVQCLEFIDTNAAEILLSEQFLELSENMVHLVLKRESSADLPEIMKVKAAFAWGELHSKPSGPNFKTLVSPLLKHIKLHLIDPQDIMKVLVPSGIFDMDKLMAALAYQVDPQAVEVDNYTMFRPRKKTNVLSSR